MGLVHTMHPWRRGKCSKTGRGSFKLDFKYDYEYRHIVFKVQIDEDDNAKNHATLMV